MSEQHFPEPVEDLVAAPLAHDSPAEIAQPNMDQWISGEGDAILGKTMPSFKVVKRDYKNVYNQYISYGHWSAKMDSVPTGRRTEVARQV
ncbi:MAG: hypothetical protein H6821_05210 [Planctomycetaceae bacterium]|nr:hypothetical protein [Planctomycetaceae bacterium]